MFVLHQEVSGFYFRFCLCHKTILPGTGGYKLGANYAPGVVPQREAAHKGYVQNLWLHGPEHHLTEVRSTVMLRAVSNYNPRSEQ